MKAYRINEKNTGYHSLNGKGKRNKEVGSLLQKATHEQNKAFEFIRLLDSLIKKGYVNQFDIEEHLKESVAIWVEQNILTKEGEYFKINGKVPTSFFVIIYSKIQTLQKCELIEKGGIEFWIEFIKDVKRRKPTEVLREELQGL